MTAPSIKKPVIRYRSRGPFPGVWRCHFKDYRDAMGRLDYVVGEGKTPAAAYKDWSYR